MATKNLARTVIEGGRSGYNKFDRRYSNRQDRQRAREFTHRVLFDAELAEATDVPRRRVVWRQHRDRLAAAERWLASFVGTHWDEVRSQMAARFDTRTIAGQHIVFDHLLPSVDYGPRRGYGYFDFRVDADGILEHNPRKGWRSLRKLPPGKVRRSWSTVERWAEGRRVAKRGSYWFWFEPTVISWIDCSLPYCQRSHRRVNGVRCHRDSQVSYRQTTTLTVDEVTYWQELTDETQEHFRLAAKS